MDTERRRALSRALLIIASVAVIVAGGVTVLRLAAGTPSAAAQEQAGEQRPIGGAWSPRPAAPTTVAPSLPETPAGSATGADAIRPGVPVAIDIPVRSSNHPHGVHASITAHPLNPDRTLFVPADPTEVAWASDDAAPGSARGTAILVSHVNYVINGRTVAGAFADLAEYAEDAIGRIISLRLADGRTLRYRIVAGREYAKEELAASPQLRGALYDQTGVFGTKHPSGRLLLVSCGGNFDPVTGEYDDNVFLFALPVS